MDNNLKKLASSTIDESTEELRTIGEKIWSLPELCYKEYKAHDLLTGFLEKKGFSVERSYTGIETAFRATFGSGRPNVCVMCEYDALPEIGHACGHNLIAEAGVAAGLGLKAALESSNAPKGRLTVMGTPAEEGGGGKEILIQNGAFEDVDVAVMVHPAPHSAVRAIWNCISSLQITRLYWQGSSCSCLPLGGSERPGCSCNGLHLCLCPQTADEANLEGPWDHHKRRSQAKHYPRESRHGVLHPSSKQI